MTTIGVDGRLLHGNLTGVGKYVLNLIDYICEQDESIYVKIYSNRAVSCTFKSNRVQVILDDDFYARLKPMIWSKLFSFRLINRNPPDIYLAGDAFVPLFLKTNKIISVVHDLNALIAPKTMSRFRLMTDKLFFKRDLKKASLIVTNSYGTAQKLKMYYNKETDIVIHPILDSWYRVIDPAIVKTKLNELGINYPYILTVATQEPRKNLDKTINAFINVKKDSGLSAFKLLLIGSKGWKSEKVEELMQLHSQDVYKLGYIDDDMMPYLYNGAHLFVFPSSYEGFGMPAKEAMLCGLPVITSDITELREATSNNAVYIDPLDQKAFEKAISAAIKKPKSATLLIPDKPADQLDKFVPAIINLKNAFK